MGLASKIKPVREYFETKRQEANDTEQRKQFQEIFKNANAIVPWGYSHDKFMEWVNKKLESARGEKPQLAKVVDAVAAVETLDGLMVLSKMVHVGLKKHIGSPEPKICGFDHKLMSATLGSHVKHAGTAEFAKLFEQEQLIYYKAVLLSCEKRSLLTDYVFETHLGKGSFGSVSLCVNRFTRVKRAVKLVFVEGDASATKTEFEKSAKETELHQLAATTDFVAKLFAWGTFDDKFLWVVLEYCSDGPLTNFIRPLGEVSDQRATLDQHNQWVNNLTRGLMYIHEAHVLHRDIKPANILIANQNGSQIAKYIDFGCACKIDSDVAAWHGVAGTKGYLAPEV